MRKQVLFALGAVVIIIGIVVGWYLITQRHVRRILAQQMRANVLMIIDLDDADDTSRSNTMTLLSVSSSGDPVLLSIPSDLRVKLNDGQMNRLDTTYTKGGASLTTSTVAALLGIDIPFYVRLDSAAFEHLVDLLGGVTITVEEAMKYDDESATPALHIDIKAGKQTLDGATAVQFVRYRGETGDLKRITRQQKLMAAILEKGVLSKDLGSVRKLVRDINPYLHTNLSLVDLYDLVKTVSAANAKDVQIATIPGTPATIDGVNCLEPQVVRMERLVAHLIRGADILTPSEVTVAVFNGNGTRMVASRTGDYLKARDFVVNKVGNAETFGYDKTYIIALTDMAKAQMLRTALPQPDEATIVSPDELSEHYDALLPFTPEGTDILLIAGKGFDIK